MTASSVELSAKPRLLLRAAQWRAQKTRPRRVHPLHAETAPSGKLALSSATPPSRPRSTTAGTSAPALRRGGAVARSPNPTQMLPVIYPFRPPREPSTSSYCLGSRSVGPRCTFCTTQSAASPLRVVGARSGQDLCTQSKTLTVK